MEVVLAPVLSSLYSTLMSHVVGVGVILIRSLVFYFSVFKVQENLSGNNDCGRGSRVNLPGCFARKCGCTMCVLHLVSSFFIG